MFGNHPHGTIHKQQIDRGVRLRWNDQRDARKVELRNGKPVRINTNVRVRRVKV